MAKKVKQPKSKPKKPNEDILKADHRNIQLVPMGRVRPNDYNYNEQSDFIFEKTKQSILELGFVDPIIVRSGNQEGTFEDGMFEIIGGEHRFKCLEILHSEGKTVFLDPEHRTRLPSGKILINDLGNVDDGRARQLCIVLNETKGKANPDELAGLVADLAEREVSLDVLPFDAVELESMIQSVDFDWDGLMSDDGGGGTAEEPEDLPPIIPDVIGYANMSDEEDERIAALLITVVEDKGLQKKPWKVLDYLVRLHKMKKKKEQERGESNEQGGESD